MIDDALVHTFIKTPERTSDPRVREAYGLLEGWVAIAVNLLVFAVKIVPGVVLGSVSLIADAFHSLGDILGSIVVIWGFHQSARPSDPEHPFGHGRIESIASLLVAVILFITAWELGQASVGRLVHPKVVAGSAGLLALLAVSIVLKEWLARFSITLGRKIGSAILIGDSWHHRSDVLATAVVILALVAGRFGVGWVDGAGGLIVAGFVGWAGWQLMRGSMNPLIGEAPSPQVLAEIRRAAMAVPGVDEVHDIIVHRYGGLVVTSVHAEVRSDCDLVRGHEIAEVVEERLIERFPGWAVVHIDPVDRRHPLYPAVRDFLIETLPGIPGAGAFHDLRLVGSEATPYVIFDLKVEGAEPEAVAAAVRAAVSARFPAAAKIGVNIEPRYVY